MTCIPEEFNTASCMISTTTATAGRTMATVTGTSDRDGHGDDNVDNDDDHYYYSCLFLLLLLLLITTTLLSGLCAAASFR